MTMRTAALVATTVTTGLMAGLYFAFSVAVMLGLHRTDDRTFISTMQKINVAILNGWFGLAFGGALVIGAVSSVLEWRASDHSALPWVIAGVVLYAIGVLVTMALNVPLNDTLEAAGDPDRIADLAGVRSAFETKWNAWNVVRTLVTTVGFGCLVWALILHGRATRGA